jgi:hypothetical protein
MSEDEALQQLHAILARPEYQFDRSLPWWQQLLAPLLDFAWRLLSQLIQLVLDTSAGREGGLGLGVLIGSVLVLAVALLYLVRAVRLSVMREAALRGASLAERRERSDQLWQTAQQLAATGQYAEAVRCLYLSALYALDERALLHVEFSLTNREHAQRLKRAYPSLGDSFGELVERYERVRYGQADVAPDGFAEFSGRAQRVRSAALEGAGA